MHPTSTATRPPSASSTLQGSAAAFTFATRQVAQILGIGEATVKRLADAGKLQALREGRARRFPADRIAGFLADEGGATGAPPPAESFGAASASDSFGAAFVAAVRAGKVNLALASVIGALASGWALLRALEELVEPALPLASCDWFLKLLARVPALEPEPGRRGSALVWSPAGQSAQAGSVACLLRGHGFQVLTPADRLASSDVFALAANAEVCCSIVVLPAAALPPLQATQLASELASNRREGQVVFYCPARSAVPPLPRGARTARSLGEVARLLAQSGLR